MSNYFDKGVMSANGSYRSVYGKLPRTGPNALTQAVYRGIYFRRIKDVGWIAVHGPSGLKISGPTRMSAYLRMLGVCGKLNLRIHRTGLFRKVETHAQGS